MSSGVHLDVEKIRRDFPILSREVHGKPLVYLDNAATTQKPRAVIDRIVEYYSSGNSNIHRGVHWLSETATRDYEVARKKIQKFLNAREDREIIFLRGTTEGINLVAQTHGRVNLKPGDEVLISGMEHHAGIVPWQMVCEQTGAKLKVIPINERGELVMDEFRRLLSPRTKIVGIVHVSNALGTVNPVKEIIEAAHRVGAVVVVDGAQAVSHMKVDVQALDADFYVFSGHKLYGPTGVGALYGKAKLLEAMPPYQGGGDMIRHVTFEKTLYNVIPHKFEAGTPDIAGGIVLGAAIDYVESIGLDRIGAYETELLAYGTQVLSKIEGIRLIGTAAKKAGVLSFVMEGVHPHDLGTILDRDGIAIRTGHHCAQPVMDWFKVPATARASVSFYNTRPELDVLAASLVKAREIFR